MNLKLTKEASDLIHAEKATIDKPDDVVLAIYKYTTRSWSRTYCYNLVQLALKQQVIDNGNFDKLNHDNENDGYPVEIYVDKMLLEELEPAGINSIVDVETWRRFGTHKKTLTLKIEH